MFSFFSLGFVVVFFENKWKYSSWLRSLARAQSSAFSLDSPSLSYVYFLIHEQTIKYLFIIWIIILTVFYNYYYYYYYYYYYSCTFAYVWNAHFFQVASLKKKTFKSSPSLSYLFFVLFCFCFFHYCKFVIFWKSIKFIYRQQQQQQQQKIVYLYTI